MSITRTRLRCNEKDCPRRDDADFHRPVCWMMARADIEHSDEAQHQHWPKRSQGGKTVVAVICSYCHDRIDNGPWGNAVEFGVYRIWDVHGNTLLRVSTAEGDAGGANFGGQHSLSAADVRGPSAAAENAGASAVAPGASSDGGEGRVAPREHGLGIVSPETRPFSPPSPGVPASEPSLGGDGAIVEPPKLQELPSPPTTQEEQDEEREAVLDKRGRAGQDDSESEHADFSRISASATYSPDRRHRDSNRQTDVAAPISESLKPNGLDLPAEFTFEEWTNLAGMVAGMNKNRQWWAGDLVLAGERFGERATNFWNDLGYRWESLSNAVRVCRKFPLQSGLRRADLSFAHHAVVYALDDYDALTFLSGAEDAGWTVKQLREAVHWVKPKTVRYTLTELREDLATWPGEPKVRNNGPRYLAAALDWLEAR